MTRTRRCAVIVIRTKKKHRTRHQQQRTPWKQQLCNTSCKACLLIWHTKKSHAHQENCFHLKSKKLHCEWNERITILFKPPGCTQTGGVLFCCGPVFGISQLAYNARFSTSCFGSIRQRTVAWEHHLCKLCLGKNFFTSLTFTAETSEGKRNNQHQACTVQVTSMFERKWKGDPSSNTFKTHSDWVLGDPYVACVCTHVL